MKKCSRLLSALLTVSVLLCNLPLPLPVNAASLDDLSYTISNGEVTIIGCDTSASGDLVIPDTIDSYPVTSIGDRAFFYCTKLSSITIPDSITNIGVEAFRNCRSLTSITIPGNVSSIGREAFEYCTGLTSITIQEGVSILGQMAFADCDSVISVTIPGSVKTIDPAAFTSCDSLKTVIIEDGVPQISTGMFNNCSMLTEVIIPTSVTLICTTAFKNCSSLTNIKVPDSVTCIEDDAFYCCSSLPEIAIPDSVTVLGSSVFSGCKNLSRVSIGSGIAYIPASTFSGCTALSSVNIPDGITSVKSKAFFYTGIKEISIPYSVQSIGDRAFADCSDLETIYYPGARIQWDAIEKGDAAIPNTAIVFCLKALAYDANGGINAPPPQEKDGSAVIISEQIPVRDDYIFLGWSTNKEGQVVCQPGDSYAFEGDCVLYAVWIKNCTITYDANGGTDAPDAHTQLEGHPFQLSTQIPTLNGAIFKGWSTSKDGTVEYAPGDSCTVNDHTVLYAVWHRNCSLCGGDGYYGTYSRPCTTCEGTGHGKCYNCGGDGISGMTTCSYCNGTGTRNISCTGCGGDGSVNTKCSTCKGSGSVTETKYVRCGFCSGSGQYWSSVQYGWAVCQNCSGTGELPKTVTSDCPSCVGGYHATNCSTCGGDGRQTISCSTTENIVCYACGGDGLHSSMSCEECDGTGDKEFDKVCTDCAGIGSVPYTLLVGDLNSDNMVDEDDAIYLLQHVLLPDIFTVSQNVDYNKDGTIDEDDAIYLLQHVLLPDLFPIS